MVPLYDGISETEVRPPADSKSPISFHQLFGAGLTTPPLARPKISLNSREPLVWEIISQFSAGSGDPRTTG
jgi:hypothetical protein